MLVHLDVSFIDDEYVSHLQVFIQAGISEK